MTHEKLWQEMEKWLSEVKQNNIKSDENNSNENKPDELIYFWLMETTINELRREAEFAVEKDKVVLTFKDGIQLVIMQKGYLVGSGSPNVYWSVYSFMDYQYKTDVRKKTEVVTL